MKHVLFVLFGIGALAACAGVADLDVKYQAVNSADGGISPQTTPDAAVAAAIEKGPPPPVPVQTTPTPFGVDASDTAQPEGAVCPCDESAGLGCCITNGTAACISNELTCGTGADAGPGRGTFLRCTGPDAEGSACCLHHFETLTETALTSECAEGATQICTIDADCPNFGKCTLSNCNGVAVGTCDGTPICP